MASRRKRRPQAARCPPNVRRWSEVRSTAPRRSKAGMLRARALGLIVTFAEQDRRTVVLLRDAGRDDADDPLVPVRRGEHECRRRRIRDHGDRRLKHRGLDGLPLAVELVEPEGEGSAASRSGAPSSSRASEASSRRPAALSRGPRRKPTAPASVAPGRPPATSSSAASPGRGALAQPAETRSR